MERYRIVSPGESIGYSTPKLRDLEDEILYHIQHGIVGCVLDSKTGKRLDFQQALAIIRPLCRNSN